MCTLQYLCLCTYLVCVCDEPINQTVCVCVWPASHLSSPALPRKHPLNSASASLSSPLCCTLGSPPSQPSPLRGLLSATLSPGVVLSLSATPGGETSPVLPTGSSPPFPHHPHRGFVLVSLLPSVFCQVALLTPRLRWPEVTRREGRSPETSPTARRARGQCPGGGSEGAMGRGAHARGGDTSPTAGRHPGLPPASELSRRQDPGPPMSLGLSPVSLERRPGETLFVL